MEEINLQNARGALAAFLEELREKRANPFKGTLLEALTPEIRELRKTHGLSYKEIAEKLASLGVKTSEAEVGNFCRLLFKPGRPRKGLPAARPAKGR